MLIHFSEDHIDMSPANNFFMTSKQGGLEKSNLSLNIDTQSPTSPMELGPLSEFNQYFTSNVINYIKNL